MVYLAFFCVSDEPPCLSVNNIIETSCIITYSLNKALEESSIFSENTWNSSTTNNPFLSHSVESEFVFKLIKLDVRLRPEKATYAKPSRQKLRSTPMLLLAKTVEFNSAILTNCGRAYTTPATRKNINITEEKACLILIESTNNIQNLSLNFLRDHVRKSALDQSFLSLYTSQSHY